MPRYHMGNDTRLSPSVFFSLSLRLPSHTVSTSCNHSVLTVCIKTIPLTETITDLSTSLLAITKRDNGIVSAECKISTDGNQCTNLSGLSCEGARTSQQRVLFIRN